MKILTAFLVVLMVGGCTVPNLTKLMSNESKYLNFADTEVFDAKLSKHMSADTENIHVTIAGQVSLNDIPDRLGKWLNVVAEKEGRVDIEPKSNTKFAAVLRLPPPTASDSKEEIFYKPAYTYNATIVRKPETNLISEVVFSKKPEARKR